MKTSMSFPHCRIYMPYWRRTVCVMAKRGRSVWRLTYHVNAEDCRDLLGVSVGSACSLSTRGE